MVNYDYKDLFWKDSVDKKMKISTDDGRVVVTNTELNQQQFELTESLCSDSELRFGSCESSMIKFTVNNVFSDMTGKRITVTMVVEGHTDKPLQIGRYKVFSDTLTADRTRRDVTAYDAMYDILNSDVAEWYNEILPSKNSSVTLKQFRESFVRYFGLTEIVPKGGLVNDNMIVKKTIDIVASEESDTPTSSTSIIGETLSGKDVITAICEINGCFGHIGRNGKFRYIYLPQAIEGLYPSETLYPDHAPEWMVQAKTGNLYPQDPKSTSIGKGNYIKCQYEDYRTKPITKIQIRQEENDIGKIWPETPKSDKDNCYIIEGNFLVYSKSSDELAVIAKNIYDKITDIIYRPFSVDCVGNPCLEVGDPISIPTKHEIVESYILKRTLKGIQALRDAYSADGQEKYSEKVNGVHNSIMQIKGKANILTRTIEETKLEMYDIEAGLNTTISVTAAGIRKEMTDADNGLSTTITETAKGIEAEIKNTKDGLEAKISATAGEIRTELKNTKDGLESSISQTVGKIQAEVKRATEAEGELSAKIEIEADRITSEVTARKEAEGELSSKINQTASEIRTEVKASTNLWDLSDVEVDYFGIGEPGKIYPPSGAYALKTYLNQSNGDFYICRYNPYSESYQWNLMERLKKIAKNASTAFTQTANEIELKASKDSIISTINQTPESIKIKASKLKLDGDTMITGGRIQINADSSDDNIIKLSRSNGNVVATMGTDGMKSTSDTREAIFQYSNVSVWNRGGTEVVAQLLDTGKGLSSYGWDSYSDRRLKHDITPLSAKDSADFIYSQTPCSFVFNYDPDEKVRHGLIAQDVVSKTKETGWAVCSKNHINGNKEYLTLNYTEFIADIIATLQYQKKQIEDLQKEINKLKGRVMSHE